MMADPYQPALEGDETGQDAVPGCVPDPQGPGTHESIGTQASIVQPCVQCGKLFAPKKRWQRFCSNPCRIAHFKRDAPPKSVKLKEPPRQPREPTDGLRCRTCTDWNDSREGWRIDCKSCSRMKMKVIHNPAWCKRKGCIVCMDATLARSTEFVAAWEAEAE